jgi:hypothetical protein
VDAQTSIATILEFPTTRSRGTWVPPHARPCTVDDVEFYSLKLIQQLCNVTCRPVTLWPSDRYGPRWAGQDAWVTYGDGRSREVPADAVQGSRPLMTLLPRHYHARIVKHYATKHGLQKERCCYCGPYSPLSRLGACGVREIDAMKSFQQTRCSQFASMAAKPLAARSAFVRSG